MIDEENSGLDMTEAQIALRVYSMTRRGGDRGVSRQEASAMAKDIWTAARESEARVKAQWKASPLTLKPN
jgi:hypothetical protein